MRGSVALKLKRRSPQRLRALPPLQPRRVYPVAKAPAEASAEDLRQRQKDLAIAAKKGDHAAAQSLVESVDKFIWQLCWRFAKKKSAGKGKSRMMGEEDIADMAAESKLQVFLHIGSYDVQYAWTTYVSWQVKAATGRWWANHSRLIRMPVHLLDKQQAVLAAKRRFVATHDREPTDAEWCTAARITARSLASLKDMWVQRGMVSLDEALDADSSHTVGDTIADTTANVEERLVSALESPVAAALQRLGERSVRYRFILEHRYGFATGEERTLLDTADALHAAGLSKSKLSRERIRQIERLAMELFKEFLEREA